LGEGRQCDGRAADPPVSTGLHLRHRDHLQMEEPPGERPAPVPWRPGSLSRRLSQVLPMPGDSDIPHWVCHVSFWPAVVHSSGEAASKEHRHVLVQGQASPVRGKDWARGQRGHWGCDPEGEQQLWVEAVGGKAAEAEKWPLCWARQSCSSPAGGQDPGGLRGGAGCLHTPLVLKPQ
jgi:hypothetical protein